MRRSFDGLALVTRPVLGQDPAFPWISGYRHDGDGTMPPSLVEFIFNRTAGLAAASARRRLANLWAAWFRSWVGVYRPAYKLQALNRVPGEPGARRSGAASPTSTARRRWPASATRTWWRSTMSGRSAARCGWRVRQYVDGQTLRRRLGPGPGRRDSTRSSARMSRSTARRGTGTTGSRGTVVGPAARSHAGSSRSTALRQCSSAAWM